LTWSMARVVVARAAAAGAVAAGAAVARAAAARAAAAGAAAARALGWTMLAEMAHSNAMGGAAGASPPRRGCALLRMA
jgi:hypothetical protein